MMLRPEVIPPPPHHLSAYSLSRGLTSMDIDWGVTMPTPTIPERKVKVIELFPDKKWWNKFDAEIKEFTKPDEEKY